MMMRDIEMPACEIVLKKCELSKGILIQKNKKTLNYTPLQNCTRSNPSSEKETFLSFSSQRKTAENNDHKSVALREEEEKEYPICLLTSYNAFIEYYHY